jgi:uncharacterized protein (DUF3820 family)
MKMPFGIHKGKDLDNVPADYLDWLSGQDWLGKFPEISCYIIEHKKSIHAELEREGKINNDEM